MKKDKIKFKKGVNSDAVLKKLIETYTEPVFGSQTKKELDLAFYHAMVDLGIIDSGADIYSLVEKLRITRTKARNLIYESKLRNIENVDMKDEMMKLLGEKALYITDGKVCLEISNPLLMDYLRDVLKKKKHITDGSFSAELVRLSPEAYLCLCKEYAKKQYDDLKNNLKKLKLIEGFDAYNDIISFAVALLKDLHIPFTGTLEVLLNDLPKYVKMYKDKHKKED